MAVPMPATRGVRAPRLQGKSPILLSESFPNSVPASQAGSSSSSTSARAAQTAGTFTLSLWDDLQKVAPEAATERCFTQSNGFFSNRENA